MSQLSPELYGPNVPLFLDLIAFSEGTSNSSVTKNNGYDVLVTDVHGRAIFTNYNTHPCEQARLVRVATSIAPALYSSAAGRYQLLYRYWQAYCRQLNLTGFYPMVQDEIAVQQIKEQKALDLIQSGDIEGAIHACSNIWASMPGNSYGQNPHSMDILTQEWVNLQGPDA
jgi:muramidase (phage lysozyme)